MNAGVRFRDPKAVCAALGLIGVSWEMFALYTSNGASWTETIREVFQVQTATGKWVFLVFYGGFVAWFPAHILKHYDWDRPAPIDKIVRKRVALDANIGRGQELSPSA